MKSQDIYLLIDDLFSAVKENISVPSGGYISMNATTLSQEDASYTHNKLFDAFRQLIDKDPKKQPELKDIFGKAILGLVNGYIDLIAIENNKLAQLENHQTAFVESSIGHKFHRIEYQPLPEHVWGNTEDINAYLAIAAPEMGLTANPMQPCEWAISGYAVSYRGSAITVRRLWKIPGPLQHLQYHGQFETMRSALNFIIQLLQKGYGKNIPFDPGSIYAYLCTRVDSVKAIRVYKGAFYMGVPYLNSIKYTNLGIEIDDACYNIKRISGYLQMQCRDIRSGKKIFEWNIKGHESGLVLCALNAIVRHANRNKTEPSFAHFDGYTGTISKVQHIPESPAPSEEKATEPDAPNSQNTISMALRIDTEEFLSSLRQAFEQLSKGFEDMRKRLEKQ